MANRHGAAALLMIASLLVAATLADAAPKPALSCSKVHSVQAGETCFALAKATGLTLPQFLGFNPNINCLRLFVGQWVCLAAA